MAMASTRSMAVAAAGAAFPVRGRGLDPDRLDDPAAVGGDDVRAEHLEPLDDLGQLTLGRLADQGAEGDEVGEADVQVDALLGRLRLGVGEKAGDRVREVPAPRVHEERFELVGHADEVLRRRLSIAVAEWSAERSPAASLGLQGLGDDCTCQDANRSAVRGQCVAEVPWPRQVAAPDQPRDDPERVDVRLGEQPLVVVDQGEPSACRTAGAVQADVRVAADVAAAEDGGRANSAAVTSSSPARSRRVRSVPRRPAASRHALIMPTRATRITLPNGRG